MDDTTPPSASTPSIKDPSSCTPVVGVVEEPSDTVSALSTSLKNFDSEMAAYRNAQRAVPTSQMSDEMLADHEGQCLVARLMHDEIGRLQSTGNACTECGCDGTCMGRYKFRGGRAEAGGAGGAGRVP